MRPADQRKSSIFKREHKAPEYLAVNPMGQTPSLALDDGSVLTESVVDLPLSRGICIPSRRCSAPMRARRAEVDHDGPAASSCG